MISIRGAITVQENNKHEIIDGTKILLLAILENNDVALEDVISIYFTGTKDLTAVYPAVAARDIGLKECSLLCAQEMYVDGSLDKCIRVLLHVNSAHCQKDVKHVYLREAKKLRPDIN